MPIATEMNSLFDAMDLTSCKTDGTTPGFTDTNTTSDSSTTGWLLVIVFAPIAYGKFIQNQENQISPWRNHWSIYNAKKKQQKIETLKASMLIWSAGWQLAVTRSAFVKPAWKKVVNVFLSMRFDKQFSRIFRRFSPYFEQITRIHSRRIAIKPKNCATSHLHLALKKNRNETKRNGTTTTTYPLLWIPWPLLAQFFHRRWNQFYAFWNSLLVQNNARFKLCFFFFVKYILESTGQTK